jgi:hypothetical protein
MLRAVARPLVNVVERWMPDALVWKVGLPRKPEIRV